MSGSVKGCVLQRLSDSHITCTLLKKNSSILTKKERSNNLYSAHDLESITRQRMPIVPKHLERMSASN